MRIICSKVLSYLIRHESGYGSPNFMVLWRLACRAQQQEQKPKETLKDKDLNINDMHTWTSAIIKKNNWSINAKTLGSLYHPPAPATEKAGQLHPDHSGPRAQRRSANAPLPVLPIFPRVGRQLWSRVFRENSPPLRPQNLSKQCSLVCLTKSVPCWIPVPLKYVKGLPNKIAQEYTHKNPQSLKTESG